MYIYIYIYIYIYNTRYIHMKIYIYVYINTSGKCCLTIHMCIHIIYIYTSIPGMGSGLQKPIRCRQRQKRNNNYSATKRS